MRVSELNFFQFLKLNPRHNSSTMVSKYPYQNYTKNSFPCFKQIVFRKARLTTVNKRNRFLIIVGLIVVIVLIRWICNLQSETVQIDGDHASLSLKTDSNVPNNGKILCYILISKSKALSAQTISQTWGKHCDKLVFFGDSISNSFAIMNFTSQDKVHSELIYLNTAEGYPYLWAKTKAAILHLYKEQYTLSYDWFLKADHDTFVIVENLRKFVSNLESGKPVWFGYKLRDSNMEMGYMSGGAGYVFSRDALKKLAELFDGFANKPNTGNYGSCDLFGTKGYEDLELGKCCIDAGIQEIPTLDSQGREQFLPLPLPTLINGDLSRFHWLWKQAWNPLTLGPNCCSPNLISIHQLSPKDMKTLYFLIYKLNLKK